MSLSEYFKNTKGTGVLSTADASGKVNAAIYSRPHILDDGEIAFIARDRLTHHNLTENPHAAYLFIEDGPGYKGKRLHLTKTGEETDTDRINELSRRKRLSDQDAEKNPRFLVIFRQDAEFPLIGAEE